MTTEKELFYRLAMLKIEGIGARKAKTLLSGFGDAERVFKSKKSALLRMPGIGESIADQIRNFHDFYQIEKEIEYIQNHNIQVLFYDSDVFPFRLKPHYDSPFVLFYKGNKILNHPKVISIVGTRSCSAYGKYLVEKLLDDLTPYNPLVISGMAYGVDIHAHKTAMKLNLPTVGVVAHGLDTMYPSGHKKIALQMEENGGLLSEYFSGTRADREHFPMRNRIVAGMADALIVIESGKKGGAMITAEIANSYGVDIYSFPGRVNDNKSEGCNDLIRSLKSQMITSGADLIKYMNWDIEGNKLLRQPTLFPALDADEGYIYDLISSNEAVDIESLYKITSLNTSKLASLLLTLEVKGVVKSVPGKRFSVCM